MYEPAEGGGTGWGAGIPPGRYAAGYVGCDVDGYGGWPGGYPG